MIEPCLSYQIVKAVESCGRDFDLAQEEVEKLIKPFQDQLAQNDMQIARAEEVLRFYAANKGLRINHTTGKFESTDCMDSKDFHGALARDYFQHKDRLSIYFSTANRESTGEGGEGK